MGAITDEGKKGGSPLGRRLRGLRGFKGWTQGDAARAAGLSPNTLSNLERGGEPTLDSLRKLAATFGVTVDWLLSDDEPLRDAA